MKSCHRGDSLKTPVASGGLVFTIGTLFREPFNVERK